MAYNINNVSTAGKVTVFSCILGLLSFALIFTINLSTGKLQTTAAAQSVATTTVTVLNTPPQWTVDAQEYGGSSTTTPTNAGDVMTWTAIGTDANSDPYYLLICSTSATPTPNVSGAPSCDTAPHQWGVSASTTSGSQVSVSTTTTAAMAEVNPWFAWICDYNASNPACNATFKQGTGTTSSPFEVNHRPTFTAFANNGPKLPGAQVSFTTTSSDSDVSGTADTVTLIVCNLNDFSTTTRACGAGGMIASSTFAASNASTTYTITIPTQDQSYSAFGFVTDQHGFAASGGSQGTNAPLVVSNATPTVSAATISIVQPTTTDMVLTQAATQTPNFVAQFTVADNNSCLNAASTSEITNYQLALYRSGVGSTTCSATSSAAYNPNNCYTHAVATTTWNIACTASSTSCTGANDTTVIYNCTFPLWYVADPTDGNATSTQYSAQNWLASVSAIDDNGATSTLSESSSGVEVTSLLAFALNTLSIPYGSLQPGQKTDPIVATTTMSATGNVGVNQKLSGESMCVPYTSVIHCPNSATSTIAENNQVFGTTSQLYASSTPMSSTTPTLLQVNIKKSTTTLTQSAGNTFWGINVPGTITLSGNYKGENTFVGVVSTSTFW
jgi:hypothetical protein